MLAFHLVPELSARHNVLLPTRIGTRRNGTSMPKAAARAGCADTGATATCGCS